MVEAARLGQLSTVRQLLDGGAATVEDQDEVKGVCAFVDMCGAMSSLHSYAYMCAHTVKIIGVTLMLAYHFGPLVPLVPVLKGFSFR